MANKTDATVFGLPLGQIEWNNDFTATRAETGQWTASESFTCQLSDVTRMIPKKGASCQLNGWSFLKVFSVKVSNIDGNLALVTCEFGGTQEVEKSEEEEEAEREYTYELGITTGEEPIETKFKYRDVPPEELAIIQNFRAGNLREVKDAPYTYQNSSSFEKGTELKVESELGKELIDLISKGVESYLYPGQIWRATYTSNRLPRTSVLNAVGTITSAINAPAVGHGRDWLFIGCNVVENNKVFTITLEWQLSGDGGWEPKIYTRD